MPSRRVYRLCTIVVVIMSCRMIGSTFAATFTNVTVAAGLTHNAIAPGGPTAPTFPEVQSGGAAAGDFDGDGWVDLFITRHFDSDLLYRNNGNGTFSDVTADAFPGGIGNLSTNGAAFADIDNDGDQDLYVTAIHESQHYLYINDGAGRFSEQAVARGAMVGDGSRDMTGTSPAFGDYDNDGYLDIYVTEWRSFSEDGNPAHARLLRNRGAANPGYFEDVTLTAGVAMDITVGSHANKALSFTPRFADLDRDGWQDLAVISDGHTSRLFWNNGDGTFTDGTPAQPVLVSGTNDMGFSLGDVDGDGLLDWFATSIYDPLNNPTGNHLFRNNGDRTFSDITTTAGVRNGGWGWGTDMFDFDNDADLDIVMTNGFAFGTSFTNDRSRLFVNNGSGAFNEAAIMNGIIDTGQGRGLLTFDYDQDGAVDVLIVNYNGAPILYRNGTNNGNDWLKVKTIGTQSNRDGIGAFITITPDLNSPDDVLVWEIDGSSNYLAQSELIAHFGLGANVGTIDKITIEWPVSGITQQLFDVVPNQLLTIIEPLAGDFDGDGDVDGRDFLIWQRDTSVGDLAGWQGNYGAGSFGSSMGLTPAAESFDIGASPVPEPAAILLAFLGMLFLANRTLCG